MNSLDIDKEEKEENDEVIDTEVNKKINIASRKRKALVIPQIETNDLIISNESIFQLLSTNLKKCFFLVHVGAKIEGELPYDKLIVLMTNIIDFLIEYKETTEDNNSILVSNILDLFFGQNGNDNNENYFQKLNRKGILKEALSAYISTEDKSDEGFVVYNTYSIEREGINEEESVKRFLLRKKVICYVIYDKIEKKEINSHYLFKIIIVHFKQLILQIKFKDEQAYQSLIKIQDDQSFVNVLLDLYSREDIFNDLIEFPLITKLYVLIKILEELYGDNYLKNHLAKLEKSMNQEQNFPLNKEKNLSIDSFFAVRIHRFLETLILKVEIKNSSEEKDEEENEEILKEEDIGDVSKLIYNKLFPESERIKIKKKFINQIQLI